MNADSRTAADALRRALASPIYNPTLRKEVGLGRLDYEVYLRTADLYALQTPAEHLVVHDEMVFQILHQTQELWLKCLSFEAVRVVEDLDAARPFAVSATLDRMVSVARCLQRDIEVLFTLSPDVFQVIRRSLGNGSGLESPGYNRMIVAAEAVAEAYERMRAARGVSLRDVYLVRAHPDLHRIAEQLCDLDGAFQGWLMAHFTLVRRTIGIDRSVRALDGFPTQALAPRMTKPLFPALWELRVALTKDWSREGGFAPGEGRASTAGSGEHLIAPEPGPKARDAP
jgi:tryptophan 2,3-dioxygenase